MRLKHHLKFFTFLMVFVIMSLGVQSQASSTEPRIILSPMDISEFRGVNEVEFIWLKVPAAVKYNIVLAKDRKFRQIVHQNQVSETSYIIGELDLGTYFFKVSAITQDGRSDSETLSLIVVPPRPARTPVFERLN